MGYCHLQLLEELQIWVCFGSKYYTFGTPLSETSENKERKILVAMKKNVLILQK